MSETGTPDGGGTGSAAAAGGTGVSGGGGSSSRLVRTLVTIEVLGDRPLLGDTEDVAGACVDGDFSGMVVSQSSADLDATRMAAALISQGSDPGFLGLVHLGGESYPVLPGREEDAVVCVHGERVWRGYECEDCPGG